MTPNGEVETVNRQCLEYFGRSLEEQKNWGKQTIWCIPKTFPVCLKFLRERSPPSIPYHFELRLRRFDGEYRWFDTRGGANSR